MNLTIELGVATQKPSLRQKPFFEPVLIFVYPLLGLGFATLRQREGQIQEMVFVFIDKRS